MKRRIAVVGAGISGLGASSLLQQDGFEVKIFEKSRGVSGRAASRSRSGCRYDHGANYFTVDDAELREWIFETLPTEELVQIGGEILPFDREGRVVEADENRSHQDRYTYRDGISSLGKKMRDEFALDVVQGARVERLHHDGSQWKLEMESGGVHDGFDAVVVTSPLPQTVQLLEMGQFDAKLKSDLLAAFSSCQYFCQYSVVLKFSGVQTLAANAYALINADRGHAISWISNEGFKSGHVPENETLFVVQMAPQWSAEREGEDKAAIARQTFAEVRDLVGDELPPPRWSDVQWWRYAHPQPGASIATPASASAAGIYFAGDGFVGKGRVTGALKSGFAAAREIIATTITA